MSKLLQEAIADAKAVRETALENAKAVLYEAFSPKLQSMLSQRLQQEMYEDEDSINEFESVEGDGTDVSGFMGRDGNVMNETEIPADAHTTDPQGPSNELSSGPSDQDTCSTKNSNTSSEGPNAGGKLTPSNTDRADVGPGKQVAASDQDTDQTKTMPSGEGPKVNESAEWDDDEELNEIISELEADLAGEEGEFGDEEFSSEAPIDGEEELSVDGEEELSVDGEEELSVGAEDALGDEEEEIDIDLEDGEESAGDIPVDGVTDDGDDEEVDLDEILREMELEDEASCENGISNDEIQGLQQEVKKLRQENAEYVRGVKYLKSKLNEVNMLNAKLLFTNKVFKTFGLNSDQKMRVVESFDRARSVREVKLTYANLCESFKIVNGTKKRSSITEGIASKAVKSTRPSATTQKKQIISEGTELANRFKKLAGIK